MILKKITLENFRPYYGVNEIEFCSGKKNITLLKAENGSGKTTLLEGIKWCLYGEELNLTNGNPKNDGMESFINKKKITEMENGEEKISASIEIEFYENEKLYSLNRKIIFYKNSYIIDVKLKIDEKEEKKDLVEIEEIIKTIIPKEVDFFVDGERLEKIVPSELAKRSLKKESQKEIKESIFRILGIKSLENAVLDMEEFYKEISKKYIKEEGLGEDEKYILTELQKKEDEFLSRKAQKDEILQEIDAIKSEIKDYELELMKLSEKYNLEENIRKDLEFLELKKLKLSKEYNEKKREYEKILSKDSWKLISNEILKNSYKMLNLKKDLGEIPTKYEKEFLEELLTIEKCICGNSLSKNTNAYQEIYSRLKTAGTRKNRETFNEVFYGIKNVNMEDIEKKIDELKINKIEKLDELKECEIKIDSLSRSLDKDILKEKSKKLEEIERLKLEENDKYKKIGGLEEKIEKSNEEIESLRKEKVELDKKQISKSVLKIKKDFAEKLLENLKILKEKKEEIGRSGLEEKIAEVYSRVNGKNYSIEIDNEFKFEIYDYDGKKVGLSKGEDKNKALSFIGGLVYYAKELKKIKRDEMDNDGGIYPLVMDAPYGDLDNSYRKEFTKFLPEISDQVVVMVSSGQWNNEIEEVVSKNIGNIYSLINLRRNNKDTKYDMTQVRREK